jgi:hypothetical protein
VQCAVGGRTGRARFQQSLRSSGSRLASDPDGHSTTEVDLYFFDDFLDRCGLDQVDLLTIDIEGAEFELLEHASRLSEVDEVVGEVHRDHPDAPADLERWLESVASRAGLSIAELHGDVFLLRRCH